MKTLFLIIIALTIISCDKKSNSTDNIINDINETFSYSQSACKSRELQNNIDIGLTVINQNVVEMTGSCPKDNKRYLTAIRDEKKVKYEYLTCLACSGETLTNRLEYSGEIIKLSEKIILGSALADCMCTFVINGLIENVSASIYKVRLQNEDGSLVEEVNISH